ncbi:MAG: peptidoglycan DD-metalloendopeptidase family protein [Pelagibacterales bacterium]|nr:peptidoglycan DD-metalloendopeptidase family protein [Pelagibacterales bacterium]
MQKTNLYLHKIIKNNLYLILLIFLLFFTILITNFYSISKKNNENNLINFLNNSYLKKSLNLIVNNLTPKFSYIDFKVEKGDTFEKIVKQLNLSPTEKELVVNKLSKFKFVNNLYKGQKISFKINNSKPIKVFEISIEKSKTKTFVFDRKDGLDKFEHKEISKNLNQLIVYKESIITNSLYSSAINKGIEPNIIIEFARIYGFQIDFQRDIWKNDSFQIVYETFLDSDNKVLDTGKILYANLILQGKENDLYIFKTKDGYEHFDSTGKSIKKSLMKTPINGARLSSNFGVRKHPILGYNKMHRGTDFAAPEGTPVMASGDGKIVRARWCGGGGNCIKIKHNSTYSTVYAHLKNFARGIREGARVKQGQIIGYVGSTGMSTGPHLHYEVIINGKKVNSQKLKLPSGKILKKKERELFEVSKIRLNVLKSKLISSQ